MKGVGWEIRPAGWILVILVAALLILYIVSRLRRSPDQNQAKT